MTRILKDNGLLSLLLALIGGTALLLLRGIAPDMPGPTADMMRSHWAFGWTAESSVLIKVLSGVLLSSTAFLTRAIGIRLNIIRGRGWLPVLVWLAVAVLYPRVLVRPDLLLGMLLTHAVTFIMLSTYRHERALSALFHAGMLSGIAMLFHGQSVLLLPLTFYGIFLMRPGAWREWLMPVMGFAMALVFVTLITVWSEDPVAVTRRILGAGWQTPILVSELHTGHMLLFVLLGLSAPSVLQDIASGAVQMRNGLLMMLGIGGAGLFMSLLFDVDWAGAVLWATLPCAVMVSNLITDTSRWWLADLMLLTLIAATAFAFVV